MTHTHKSAKPAKIACNMRCIAFPIHLTFLVLKYKSYFCFIGFIELIFMETKKTNTNSTIIIHILVLYMLLRCINSINTH